MPTIKPSPVIIIGRTNVGKSSLFNRLIGTSQALVSPIDHTTRDANHKVINWNHCYFELIDTAGLSELTYLTMGHKKAHKLQDLSEKMQYQTGQLLQTAAVVLFVVDARAGLLPGDRELARACQKILSPNIPILLVANKTENPRYLSELTEFYTLGWGDPWPVSALTGQGTGDLLDEIVRQIKKQKTPLTNKIAARPNLTITPDYRVVIMGKTNVGKSSLLNSLSGYERMLVSSQPHTTREPQSTIIKYQEKIIELIDTAGLSRRQPKAKNSLEKRGMTKSLQQLNEADIALLVIDISQPITHQEASLAEEIINRKKSLIIVANKWDKVEKPETAKFTEDIYHRLPFIEFAPIAFVSAKTKSKVQKILDLIIEVGAERSISLSNSQLEHFLSKIVKHHLPAKGKGLKHPHIYSLVQTEAGPPCFTATIGIKDNLHFSYLRFIQNQLRYTYGFIGTPISIHIAHGRQINPQHKSNH